MRFPRSLPSTAVTVAVLVAGCAPDSPDTVLAPEAALLSMASCTNIRGTDIAQFTSPTTAVGDLFGDLEGSFEATILDIRAGDDGSLHLVAQRTITNSAGTITTSDSGVLSPVEEPLYRANGQYTFVSGTGLYENVSGGIRIHGDVNLGTGEVALWYHGRICI